jgi:hypothetical protein
VSEFLLLDGGFHDMALFAGMMTQYNIRRRSPAINGE